MLTSCKSYKSIGNDIDNDALLDIERNVCNKGNMESCYSKYDVLSKAGTPNIITDNAWYYVNRNLECTSFTKPKPIDQTITVVKFSENKLLEVVTTKTNNFDFDAVSLIKTEQLSRAEDGFFSNVFGHGRPNKNKKR
jgi:hypothetical protein